MPLEAYDLKVSPIPVGAPMGYENCFTATQPPTLSAQLWGTSATVGVPTRLFVHTRTVHVHCSEC